jgi:hypothetical protein
MVCGLQRRAFGSGSALGAKIAWWRVSRPGAAG